MDQFVRISVFIEKLSERQYCWRVIEDFHCQEYTQFFDIHSCLFMRCTSPLAVMTIVGLHDFVKVSISALLRSFVLIMCIDAPESTTNSLSSGFNVDAGRHLFSGDEKNAAFSCTFNLNTFLASFHAASRAPCSCHSVSSCERSSNFGALGLRSWGSPGQMNVTERGILTCNSLYEFHTLDRLRHVSALPENRLRRRHDLKYATQLSCIRKSTFRWILSQFLITSFHGFSPVDRDIHLRQILFLANFPSSI